MRGSWTNNCPLRAALFTFLGLMAASEQVAAYDNLTELEQLLVLLNAHRESSGLGTISGDYVLQEASEWMSDDMSASGIYSRTDSLGRNSYERTADFGYSYLNIELLGNGYPDVSAVLAAWIASPPHNDVLLNPSMVAAGFGHTGRYWVLDLGMGIENLISFGPDVGTARITSIEGGFSGGLTLRWTCAPGYQYQVMVSPSLAAGSWTPAGAPQVAGSDDQTLFFLDHSAAGKAKRFYQVESALPP